jgi:hypothetical protein
VRWAALLAWARLARPPLAASLPRPAGLLCMMVDHCGQTSPSHIVGWTIACDMTCDSRGRGVGVGVGVGGRSDTVSSDPRHGKHGVSVTSHTHHTLTLCAQQLALHAALVEHVLETV